VQLIAMAPKANVTFGGDIDPDGALGVGESGEGWCIPSILGRAPRPARRTSHVAAAWTGSRCVRAGGALRHCRTALQGAQ
jgi:hypothetical protein